MSPALGKLVSPLFVYKGAFGIKWLLKVDMPLDKETPPYLSIYPATLIWHFLTPILLSANYKW